MKKRTRPADPIEWFVGMVHIPACTSVEDSCWCWVGPMTGTGYGVFSYATGEKWKSVSAHRYSYQRAVGEIPEGLELDHLCRNRGCVNPSHLEAVTHSENMRRRGRYPWWALAKVCKYGHEFTPENTYIRPDTGGRQCRTCIKARSKVLVAKRKQKRAEERSSRLLASNS